MALLQSYNINAMATQISKEFYINENPEEDNPDVELPTTPEEPTTEPTTAPTTTEPITEPSSADAVVE